MNNMFEGCENIETIDVSRWNTSNVYNTGHMFCNCVNLKTINLMNWNMLKNEIMTEMFKDCTNLVTAWLDNWRHDTYDCGERLCHMSIEELSDLEKCPDVKIIDMVGMFKGCSQLKYVSLKGWKFTEPTTIDRMFADCTRLQHINTKSCIMSHILSMKQAFQACSSLLTLDLSNFNLNFLKSSYGNVLQCTDLLELDLSKWKLSQILSFHQLFEEQPYERGPWLEKLQIIYLPESFKAINLDNPFTLMKLHIPPKIQIIWIPDTSN